MSYTVTGKVEKVLPVQKGTTKKGDEWQKQVFVVRTSDEYDNLFALEAFGEKGMEQMKGVSEGAEVTVEFNVKTNEWQGKYYSSLGAWKVEVHSSGTPAQPRAVSKQEQDFANQSGEEVVETVDDLPF